MNNRKQNPYKHKYSSPLLSRFSNFKSKPNNMRQKPTTSMVDKLDTEPLLRDTKGRRIIVRHTLYEDPDLFNFSQESSNKFERLQGWLKSGEDSYTIENEQSEICNEQNKVQRELNNMLARPVQVTKAERMMKRMGWQGGALGKHGDGIIEPIVPNASYVGVKIKKEMFNSHFLLGMSYTKATKTVGLGQTAKRMKNANEKEKDKKDEDKEYFYTNVLFHVLDFVKNDLETEIAFDCCLCKRERKWVHNIVEALANNENAVRIDFDTIVQMEIAQEIIKFNNYLLTTESEGVFPNRSLCLYKEAPETMYLVKPDDLKEDDTESEVDNSKQCDKHTKNTGSNSSVIENISEIEKDPNNLGNDLLTTIIEYFTEFVDDDNYNEFRFLGPFNSKEIDTINTFVNKSTKNEFKENDVLKDVFNNDIKMKENCNGNMIFCKTSKNLEGKYKKCTQ